MQFSGLRGNLLQYGRKLLLSYALGISISSLAMLELLASANDCMLMLLTLKTNFKKPHYRNYKTFLGIIYATSGVFPYDVDRGQTNSNVITPKISFIRLAIGLQKIFIT
jgi:hypothetical protein